MPYYHHSVTDNWKKETTVAVIAGSKNDLPKIESLFDSLDKLSIKYTVFIISAHRNKDQLEEFLTCDLPESNIKFVIAVAGMAAHLGGTIAADIYQPVFGIPIPSGNDPDGLKTKFAMSELPPGFAQVAVLADNIKDNCTKISNLIARTLSVFDPEYDLKSHKEVLEKEKPAQIPYILKKDGE